jgi:FAT domain
VHDVELNNNASFYRAILAVHKENYGLAMSLIHETREQLSGMYTALLSVARLFFYISCEVFGIFILYYEEAVGLLLVVVIPYNSLTPQIPTGSPSPSPSDAISSLLSESYSRAYRAMVSMQILAEMEEVVELKQSASKPTLEVTS